MTHFIINFSQNKLIQTISPLAYREGRGASVKKHCKTILSAYLSSRPSEAKSHLASAWRDLIPQNMKNKQSLTYEQTIKSNIFIPQRRSYTTCMKVISTSDFSLHTMLQEVLSMNR